jgi:hypothetical protein
LLASYNPVLNKAGQPYKILKLAMQLAAESTGQVPAQAAAAPVAPDASEDLLTVLQTQNQLLFSLLPIALLDHQGFVLQTGEPFARQLKMRLPQVVGSQLRNLITDLPALQDHDSPGLPLALPLPSIAHNCTLLLKPHSEGWLAVFQFC